MRNRRKAAGDIRLNHPPAAPRALIDEHLQGVMRRPLRAEPEAARQEIRLEDRLEHDLHRGLHDPVANRRNRQRTLLRSPRLGYQHPPGRQRPVPAFLQLASQLIKQPGDPVLLDSGQGDLVDARRAVIPAHRDPRAPQHIPAADLVIQRVEPSPGIGLGRPVQRMLQGTDRIPRYRRSLRGGTSTNGTHRTPPPQQYAPTKQRPIPSPQVVLSCGSTGTTAASDAHPASNPLPGVTGYRTPRSGDTNPQVTGPGRASPVPAATIDTFRTLYAGEFFTAAIQALHRFHGLHPDPEGLGTPLPRPHGQAHNDAAGFASRYG